MKLLISYFIVIGIYSQILDILLSVGNRKKELFLKLNLIENRKKIQIKKKLQNLKNDFNF